MNVSLYIAKRYLISKKKRNAINIISWISVLSIGIGTFALVVVLSAFNGLEGLVESLFESFDSDIRIEAKEGKTFQVTEDQLANIKNIEGVANYTQVLEEVCGVRFKNQQTIATIKGVENQFIEMSNLDSSLIEGSSTLIRNNINFAISGYGIAASLGMYLNSSPDNMTIYAPKRGKIFSANPLDAVTKKIIAPGGVFYISPDYDEKYILVPLRFAQDLLNYSNEITAIEVKAGPKVDLDDLKQDLTEQLGNQFKISTRYEFNELIYKTNKTEKWVTFLILVFILIIAAFNILSSLSMLIIDKKDDIETLKSIGANNALIRRIFFTEGILINLTGALSGLILGVMVCLLQEHVGLLRLEGGIVEYYPVKLNPVELLYILATVIVIGFLCSWYPVRNLTKVKL
ncbi:MAG: ABC transporter permease [Flavobacteriales bacterium]|nr:ABC transporter permease [Flavobacteriales bacterium]